MIDRKPVHESRRPWFCRSHSRSISRAWRNVRFLVERATVTWRQGVEAQVRESSRRHKNFWLNRKLRPHLYIDLIYTGHRERRHDRIRDSAFNLVHFTLN